MSGPTAPSARGPLDGVRVVELAGLGAAPFCGMMLSDMGAEVIRVGGVTEVEDGGGLAGLLGVPGAPASIDVLQRGRKMVAIDLKHPDGRDLVFDLVRTADALIEGFRPGVMERLGLGPQDCFDKNPRIVYGRMTGWGQNGPYAPAAGHDINYIALAGALDAIGHQDGPPTPPLNVVGDFGGGGMLLAVGILAAMLDARATGEGQVVDAAMVDGSALLMSMMHGLRAAGVWVDRRGSNFNDTGSHFYNVYETADGRHVTVGAMEPAFYAQLLDLLGVDSDDAPDQWDPQGWEVMKRRLADCFRRRTLREWCDMLEGTDACFAPVLRMDEAPSHPHNAHRGTFMNLDGVVQPAPAPRFSRTAPPIPTPPAQPGSHTREVLVGAGVNPTRVDMLRERGVIAWPHDPLIRGSNPRDHRGG